MSLSREGRLRYSYPVTQTSSHPCNFRRYSPDHFYFCRLRYDFVWIGRRALGVNNTITFKHYMTVFGLDWNDGIVWSGAAWDSRPHDTSYRCSVTAALGFTILNAQKFYGQNAFEFGTMLSFAIPGTVICQLHLGL